MFPKGYRIKFLTLWADCLKNGCSASEARWYAEEELKKEYKEFKPNE